MSRLEVNVKTYCIRLVQRIETTVRLCRMLRIYIFHGGYGKRVVCVGINAEAEAGTLLNTAQGIAKLNRLETQIGYRLGIEVGV